MTETISEEIDNDLTEDDKKASIKAKTHRPPLNFYEMGMKKSDILHWKDNPEITITVYSERTVFFKDKEMAISAVTRDLKNSKYYVAPGNFWMVGGRMLNEVYDETYPMED